MQDIDDIDNRSKEFLASLPDYQETLDAVLSDYEILPIKFPDSEMDPVCKVSQRRGVFTFLADSVRQYNA